MAFSTKYDDDDIDDIDDGDDDGDIDDDDDDDDDDDNDTLYEIIILEITLEGYHNEAQFLSYCCPSSNSSYYYNYYIFNRETSCHAT